MPITSRPSAEPTLARLAASKERNGQPFLQAHHLAAADRLSGLIARAQLVQRVTMSYDAAHVGGRRGGGAGASDMSDSAADARRLLNRLAETLPIDCWGVAFDVCALEKGFQAIETERQWPRRSAKLVLRIALDQLAAAFGLSPHVAGLEGRRTRGWLEERLPLIPREP